MSFTIKRTKKNGDQVPIKLSIWDAFKGVPIPKPRPHKCNCCKKIHKPDSSSEAEGTNGKDGKPGQAVSEFTAEEDKKLTEMKTANKSWKEIENELNKKQHILKARWKEIDPAKKDEKSGEGSGFTAAEDARLTELKGGESTRAEIATEMKKEREDLQARWREINPEKKAGANKPDQASEAKMSKKEKKAQKAQAATEEEKKQDSKPEPEASKAETIAKPATSGDKHKWEAAAAKHYDRTGKRITAEQARKMAEK